MSGPRFLFLAVTAPASRATGMPGTVYLWRLVAGNNHVLGRAPVGYADVEQCRSSVEHVLRDVHDGQDETSHGSRPGCWRWQLVLPGPDGQGSDTVLAIAARSYERQRESQHSLASFRTAVPVATVSTSVVVRPQTREVSRWIPMDGRTSHDALGQFE